MKKRLIVFIKFTFFVFISATLFISCATQQNKIQPSFSFIEKSKKEFNWDKLEEGVWYSKISYNEYPLIVHAVKIDLKNPQLKIITTEEKMFKKNKAKVKRETALSFAKRHNSLITVNAAFFDVKSQLFSSKAKVLGLHVSDGKILNPPRFGFDSVYFFTDNSALIREAAPLDERIIFQDLNSKKKYTMDDVNVAVSGRKIILKNGKAILTGLHPIEDSRTCVGISKDRRTLYFVFIEAENKRKSRGVTYDQAAFFMQKLGASDALHLDGGGSSSLVIKRKTKDGKEYFKTEVPSISFFSLKRLATHLGFVISF